MDPRPLDESGSKVVAFLRQHYPELAAVFELPTDPYLGLDRQEAEALAQSESRILRELKRLGGPRRADLRPRRVNVFFGADGKVVAVDAG